MEISSLSQLSHRDQSQHEWWERVITHVQGNLRRCQWMRMWTVTGRVQHPFIKQRGSTLLWKTYRDSLTTLISTLFHKSTHLTNVMRPYVYFYYLFHILSLNIWPNNTGRFNSLNIFVMLLLWQSNSTESDSFHACKMSSPHLGVSDFNFIYIWIPGLYQLGFCSHLTDLYFSLLLTVADITQSIYIMNCLNAYDNIMNCMLISFIWLHSVSVFKGTFIRLRPCVKCDGVH